VAWGDDEPAVELLEQDSAEGLHRYLATGRLATGRLARRRACPVDTAVQVLRRHHGDGQPGGVDTAFLLCTDERWERQTAQVVRLLAASDVLDGAGLDELGDRLLWPDRLCFVHPWIWFGTHELVIPISGHDPIRRVRVRPETTVATPRHDAPRCAGGRPPASWPAGPSASTTSGPGRQPWTPAARRR
jgi:hypothetical protein